MGNMSLPWLVRLGRAQDMSLGVGLSELQKVSNPKVPLASLQERYEGEVKSWSQVSARLRPSEISFSNVFFLERFRNSPEVSACVVSLASSLRPSDIGCVRSRPSLTSVSWSTAALGCKVSRSTGN